MDGSLKRILTLVLTAVLVLTGCSGFLRRKHVQNVKVLGFDWKNCGQPDAPVVLKNLTVSPDPITIPGSLTASASGSLSVKVSAPLPLSVALEKEVVGIWVKIPCVDDLGSCNYPDACDILDQLTPPGQDCPEPLHTYGLPCRCPFKAGSYSLPKTDFYLPYVDLPYWLTNGNYRAQVVLGSQDKELGCLQITLSIHSN